MSKEDLDPEIYKEIWGEYPSETTSAPPRRPDGAVSQPVVTEAVTEARLNRETSLAAIEPHLMAVQSRLAEIESRLEGIERELKEIGNRGLERGFGGS